MAFLIGAMFAGGALFVAGVPGCGGPFPGVRWAPNEEQKAARDVAHKVAIATQQHGLPPRTPAAGALVDSTMDATIDAGRPKAPIPIDALIPEGTATAWEVRTKQVDAYRAKTGLLLRGLQGQADRLTGLATEMGAATGPVEPAVVARRLEDIAANAGASIDVAATVQIPDSPSVSEAEQRAAQAVAASIHEIGVAAAAAANRPVTPTDIAGKVVDEADFWHGQLAPILASFGIAIPGVAVAIKKGKDAVNARREFEASRRSGGQVVNQAQAFMDGPIGQQPVRIGEETTTVAELFKAFLSGQDADTRKFVTDAKRAA